MFKVKTYEDTNAAVKEAKAWLKEKFPNGSFGIQSEEDCDTSCDTCRTPELIKELDGLFSELDQREGRLICHNLDHEAYVTSKYQTGTGDKGIKAFNFFETPTEEDIAFHKEFEQKHAIFEEAGGQRELFIKDKAAYLREHAIGSINGSGCGDGIDYDDNPASFKKNGLDWVKSDFSNLDARRECIHCGSVFQIKDYKVVSGMDMDYIVCPHYPHCDGSIIDWMPTNKPVKVSEHIIAAPSEQDEPEGEDAPQPRCISECMMENTLAECELPAGEGLAVFYNENPKKDDEFVLVAVKRSMYEQMKDHLEEVLQPSRWYDENNDRTMMIQPAVFIIDRRGSAVEGLMDLLEDDCKFDKDTLEKVKQFDRDVLLQLDAEFDADNTIVGGLSRSKKPIHNLRERVNRLLGKGDESYDFAVKRPPEPVRRKPPQQANVTTIFKDEERVGRNEPCPCKSGKKYKHCCLKKE